MEASDHEIVHPFSGFYGANGVAGEPQRHTFTSGDHIITMDVSFADPYVVTPLAFHSTTDPLKQIWLAGNGESGACPNRFVGAVATVRFTVKRASGKLRGKTSIREYVTVTAQSSDLPPRPPFDKTQVLMDGAISDVQAFGCDESDIAQGARG